MSTLGTDSQNSNVYLKDELLEAYIKSGKKIKTAKATF